MHSHKLLLVNAMKKKLCSKGYRASFMNKRLARVTDESMEGDTIENWMNGYTEFWMREAIAESSGSSIADILYRAGLSRRCAARAESAIAPLFNTCYTFLDLVDIARTHILSPSPSHPNIHKGEWLFGSKPHSSWEEVRHKGKMLRIWNVRRSDVYPSKDDLLFHAASWKSSLNIFRHGINIGFGRMCLDFGIQRSFYATPNYEDAIEWGERHQNIWGKEVAIIVFRQLPNTTLKEASYASADNEEWKKLVTHSRRCKGTSNYWDSVDIVKGPMLQNVMDVAKTGFIPRAHKPPKMQWGFKTAAAATHMHASLFGIIFIEKA